MYIILFTFAYIMDKNDRLHFSCVNHYFAFQNIEIFKSCIDLVTVFAHINDGTFKLSEFVVVSLETV